MKISLYLALFACILCGSGQSAFAQTAFVQSAVLPNAPSVQTSKTPKAFWALTGAYTASVIADGITTHNNIANGCVENWSSSLYGSRPSNARFYITSFAIEAGAVFAGRQLMHSRSRFLRAVAYGMLSTDTEEHFRGAIHNLSVASSCGRPSAPGPVLTINRIPD